MDTHCTVCGTAIQEKWKFCPGCGSKLVDLVKDSPERRQLTVMFVDLVDSTKLSVKLDPEDMRDILQSYHDSCAREIAQFDGYVAKYMGDGVLAYFGWPMAHEDDAERAVHAALKIVEVGKNLNPRPDLKLQVRIGIATGLVIVGDRLGTGASLERAVIGETPNLAARLQGLAEPNTVVIASSTRQLLGTQFEFEDGGMHALKGFDEPVHVWQVIAARQIASRFQAVRTMAPTPLMGRSAEMHRLESLWHEVLGGRGQVALVSGEAGIGKSRLVRAFAETRCATDSATFVELQCSPHHTQSALFPIVEWLRRQISEYTHTRGESLSWEDLKAFLGETSFNLEEVLPIFANILAIAMPVGHPPQHLTPERRRRLTQQYLMSLSTERVQTKPMLYLMEDLHWADPSTLEFMELFAEQIRSKPILALFTYRPDFSSAWSSQNHITNLVLGRLQGDDAVELVRRVPGAQELAPKILERVLAKTDGIPLYLEEFTKAIIESQQASRNGDASDVMIPATLQDSLLARLDRLGAAKEVAQMASMLGREFDHAVMQAVWTGGRSILDDGLHRLVEGDFLIPRSEPSRQTYLFKHALIQDAAYESLLKSSRVTNHRHIAEVIELQFSDIAAQQPELLARHYDAGKCAAKAVQFWLAAGQQSLQRNAYVEAIAHLRNGQRLVDDLGDNHQRSRNALDLEISLIPALVAADGYGAPEVEASSKRAMELCDMVGDVPRKFPALFGLWTFHCVRANHATSLELAFQFLTLAEAAKNEALVLEGNLIVGIALFFQGRLSEAVVSLDKCVADYDRQRHGDHAFQFGQDPAVVACNFLSWVHWLLGNSEKALHCGNQALSLARSLGHPFSLSFALSFAGWHRLYCRECESADEFIREDIQLCTDQDIQVFLAHGLVLSAWSACESGNVVRGISEMKAALDSFRATGARCFLPYWDAFFAMAHATAGDTPKADEILRQTFEEMERSGERWAEAELYRYRGLLLSRQGADAEEIEQSYRRALEVADRQGAKAWSLRAATSLAQMLKDQGKGSEGRDVLERVVGTFSPDAGSRDLDDARSLLGLVSQS